MTRIKRLILITLIPLSLLYSWNGDRNADASKDSTSASSISSTKNSNANSTGGASFSATIDGTNISGKEIDNMQLTNTDFIYPASNESPQRLFFF